MHIVSKVYNTDMEQEVKHGQPLSKAELLARIVGNSLEHDQEDIALWRAASEQEHGQTLYQLLARGERIRKSIAVTRQEPNRLILQKGRIRIEPKP